MDADLSAQGRPLRSTRPVLIVAAIAVVAITASLLVGSGSGPSPSSSPVAVESSTTSQLPGPTQTSTPGEAWAPLSLEPIKAVASLAPVAADDAGVQPDTQFALESLTDEPAAALASRLEVVPATKLKVSAGSDALHVTVRPATSLLPGSVYRFALRTPDGALSGSWAFRVRGPLHVVSSLPGDRTTRVPITTGIEVTFDQEDAGDMAPFFAIEPAVTGRFERHGRTQVFVPSALEERTVYTVTIKAGLERTGTDLKLEHDVVFRFETARVEPAALRWIVGRDVIETSPSEAPVLGLTASRPGSGDGKEQPVPTTADVKVYRFQSEAAATTALQAFLGAPRWTEYSSPTLPVADLPLAIAFTATLEPIPSPWDDAVNSWAVRFPTKLTRGWYAVEIAGAQPAYAFLQVTRVSAWVSVLKDRTILWVNDVVAHAPIGGATAALPGKASFGTSRADGVLNGPTPAALLPAAAVDDDATLAGSVVPASEAGPIVVVRAGSDVLLVAFDVADSGVYRGEWWETWYSGDETYWSLLFTDRSQYRATDTVAIWGYLRARDADAVPSSVDIRIISQGASDLVEAPALASERVEPDPSGVFSLRLSFDRAELGGYVVVAVRDGRVVASTTIDVTVLPKPEYQLSVTANHLAVITGTTVRLAASASFFDGTPVPGIPLRFGESERDFGPTDAAGAAAVDWVATVDEDYEDATWHWLGVSPSGPESGEIYADTTVVVFPASEQLDASGAVSAGRLKATATLRGVNLTEVERQLAAGEWSRSPGGRAIAGRGVIVTVTELVPVKTKIGTRYDFIEKVVVPIYDYSTTRKALGMRTITSDVDGRVILDIAVPDPSHQYEARFSTKDASGRAVRRTITVGTAIELYWSDAVTFTTPAGKDAGEDRYGVGDAIAWTMHSDAGVLPSDAPNAYLYVVAQRGLVAVSTSDSPTFRRTFRATDAPGVFVMGVRFTGVTYAPKAAAWADFRTPDRRIDVTVTPDRARYRPGDDIKLRVRTLDADGRPLSADVVLQAVDEKLYAMGAAYTPDPLTNLYRRVDSAIVRLTSTHQVPSATPGEGEGGAGGGGGPRTDFRDMLAFVKLHTNADGLATTTIKASDDLTAWHVSASALTADLQAGVGELLVPVGLPLFASVTVADEYLVTDQPSIRLRAFGLDLQPGDDVAFTVSSTTLGMAPKKVTSTAFVDTWLSLPQLQLGRQAIDVAVVAPDRKDAAGDALTDRVIVSFDVVASRVTVPQTGYGVVGQQLPSVPGSLPATYTFTDAGRGRYLTVLEDLVASTSIRLDRGLAGAMARAMLQDVFGRDATTLPPDTFDLSRYPVEGPRGPEDLPWSGDWQAIGIGLLPYAGADPWLATRVAIEDPAAASAFGLQPLLEVIRDDVTLPRDLRIAAVAGLASLGAPVFADVAAIRAETDLTAFERIHLGLAAAALGDDATARAIERDLAAAHGQRLGPWVRLSATSDRDDVAEMTALFALLAARVGDSLAPAILDYVRANPSAETSHALETAATVSALLERTPAVATSFAYTVEGKRTVVDIGPGDSTTITLTAQQRATLTLERISGEVGAAVTWREPADLRALALDPTIAVSRTAAATAPADRVFTVNLRAAFTAAALDTGCYLVVEQVPSGLIPLAGAILEESAPGIIWPSQVVGQQVTFCVAHDDTNNLAAANLRYQARVVSTGSFSWEPAIMTIDGVPEVVTVSDTGSVRIGG